ncbi:splicing factor U2AF 26 kDa subunit isoform X2 [Balaenoptera acutorostrata]|uniref:Splicing factor U2AF 26 kDa subunit isoform X2 n=1 Tax=Balaenoptera acutorostrata TaxID=9767 RepID=A0ABM3SHQ0_BALAC|nr:splicing factor U2AF 26 kDa subunit isoform X2 [Balaenoptera acutorostrata]
MAEYLASIFGTEKDKVNCSFYFKIGACRHGDRCSRLHNKPTFSQTIVLLNLYRNPQNTAQTADGSHCHVSDVEVQEHYDNFFEEVFTELQEKYGEIEEMNVCDNLGDHLVGNVYVKFRREEDAERAVAELNNRWFNGQAVHAELSPVTDFRESCCRQYEMGYGSAGVGWSPGVPDFCVCVEGAVSDNGLIRPSMLYPGNVPGVVSATSCTCDLSPATSGGSSMGGDPGAGHPQGPILATVPEKEIDDGPQTTGMAVSEMLTSLPSTPGRHICSWPGPLLKAPLTP